MIMQFLIEGYIEDYIYEWYYCKKRYLAGFLDIVHFYLSILEGIGAAIGWIRNGFIAFLISQQRLNVPSLPKWILQLYYGDEFHLAYMGFIYMIHAHNNPIVLTAADYLVESINKKWAFRLEKFNELELEEDRKRFIDKSEKVNLKRTPI